MKKLIPVEGHPQLARDASTGAIVNINTKSLTDARAAKQRRKEKDQELEQLKEDVAEIKQLLRLLVNKNG